MITIYLFRGGGLIRLLPIVRLPGTLRYLHIGENRLKRRLLGRAGIDAEAYLAAALMQVAYAHLGEMLPVLGTLNAIVILAARKSIPHGFNLCINGCRGPIGIPVVGNHASQMLELLILIFHAGFQPILAVKIERNAALVESVVASCEISLHNKAEELFFRLHLEHRGVVILEMIVGTLPQVGFGLGDHFDCIALDNAALRFAGPREFAAY